MESIIVSGIVRVTWPLTGHLNQTSHFRSLARAVPADAETMARSSRASLVNRLSSGDVTISLTASMNSSQARLSSDSSATNPFLAVNSVSERARQEAR